MSKSDEEARGAELLNEVTAGYPVRPTLAKWSVLHEDPVQRAERHLRLRALRWQCDPDGMVQGWFCLPALEAAKLTTAVDATLMRRRNAPAPRGASEDASANTSAASMELGYDTLAQQRADALVDLATNGGTKTDAEIVLHVRADGARLMTERLSLVT